MKKFLINHNTRQIHHRPNLSGSCRIFMKNDNVQIVGWFKEWWLRTFYKYDGCGHCYKEKSKRN